ncbi:MAG TPA: esterase-like activity of phytase family protein [Thermohalobaculum sp.]|nr:esterase-like activity of phytase family protein [Thermohalobaculum sp.]
MRAGRLAAAALAVLVLAAAGPPAGWQQALPEGGRLGVRAEPVALEGRFDGLAPAGAWVLRSSHPEFGGLSGILVEDGRLYAVTDRGWWFGAALAGEGDALRLEDARLAPMRDAGGETHSKAGGDAEGLTRVGGRLAVSFERDHRIMLLGESGRLGDTIQPRSFEQFPSNNGLEALATLPDGRLLALAETRDGRGVPVFVIDPGGEVREARLPAVGRHAVTGGDVGPDGRLYLVLRDYALLRGVSIRVMRYRLGADGLPEAGTAETLAGFEQTSGIDNMEGIAVERAADGRTRLWLISDDNFNPLQRTLLLRFEVVD